MTHLIQVVFDGLGSGAGYVIIALGFSLIFGVAGVLNVAHADFYTVGAYAALLSLSSVGENSFVALSTALIVGIAIGLPFYLIVVRRVAGKDQLAAFVATLGISMFLQNVIARVAGPDQQAFPQLIERRTFIVGGVVMPSAQLAIIAAACLITAALVAVLRYTSLGKNIRAIASSPQVAAAFGINVGRTMLVAVTLSCVVATVGGLVIGNEHSTVTPFMANSLSVKMFIVVLVAGARSVSGAAVVGFGLGLLESFTIAYGSSAWQDMVGLLALLLVLLVKPAGLFGRPVRVG